MDLKYIKYEKKDHLAYITFNRPEVMNAMHPPCHLEMDSVWDDFVADRNLWVAIVTGAGDKAFSAGNDLKYTAATRRAVRRAARAVLPELPRAIDINKPIIAAVNGFALGGGCEIALACDIIIAADHARFGLPEPRVGLMAGAGGVHRLPRHIPLKIAMGMMMTGRHITAAEAHRWGLANEVVPLKDLIATAENWAAEIMECSPLSIQASKEAAYQRPPSVASGGAQPDQSGDQETLHSKDLIEGPRAFAEKRKPNWKGE